MLKLTIITMSIFVLLTLCIQACLVQNVYSQCGINTKAFGFGPTWTDTTIRQGIGFGSRVPQIYETIGLNTQAENILQESECYGGTGVGEVFANGMLPVEGYTSIAGQVPTIGVVRFEGPVQAKGSVSISGSCGCGCQF